MGHLTYAVLILVWAMPLIIIQWLLGLDILLRRWKVLFPAILIPTLYLTIADGFAIGAHTWTISPAQSLNTFFPLINVPLEEGLFFLVTNTLVVQGLIFLWTPEMRQRIRFLVRLVRRGPGLLQRRTDTPEVTITTARSFSAPREGREVEGR